MNEVRFFVEGDPKTAGSKVSGVAYRKDATGARVPMRRADGRIVTFTKDSSGEPGVAWRTDIRAAARDAMLDDLPMTGPVAVSLTFRLKRPGSHYRSGAHAGTLKANAPLVPITRPDIDKLSRAVLDALKGITWGDDSQVVQKVATKRYANPGERVGVDVVVALPVLSLVPESVRPQLELIQ
jgi:crossover junction endodeoxyribonuclease RusA